MATDGSTAPAGVKRFRYAREGGGGRPGLPPDDTAARAVADHHQRWGDAAAAEKLTVAGDGLTDLAPLSALTAQTALEITSGRLTSIEPLAAMTALRDLTLAAPVLDLRALGSLSRLEFLVLRGVRATDLTPLAGLPALTRVSLLDTRIRDLRPLARLPALRHVTIVGGPVTDVAPLAGAALETVTVTDTAVTSAPRGGTATWTVKPYPPHRKPERAREVPSRAAADLITRFRNAAAARDPLGGSMDAYRELRSAGQDLIASKDATAVAEVPCSDRRLWSWAGPRDDKSRMTLRGLALRGGDGSTGFPAGNPWGIPADATVEQAIRHVWAPVAPYVPAFVDCLVERVFAVGVVAHPDGDFLTYLYGSTVQGRAIDWEAPIEHLMTTDGVTAEVGWGAAPRVVSDRAVVPLLGGPLPGPLRELARVHSSLYFTGLDGHYDCDGLERYSWGYDDDDFDDEFTMADHLGFPPERYVLFAGYQDGAAAFDLDQLDACGNPKVASHDCNDGLDTADVTEFWDWFDREFQFYLLGSD